MWAPGTVPFVPQLRAFISAPSKRPGRRWLRWRTLFRFQADAQHVSNYVRTVLRFDIVPEPASAWGGGQRVWALHVRGTAFLWHQVPVPCTPRCRPHSQHALVIFPCQDEFVFP